MTTTSNIISLFLDISLILLLVGKELYLMSPKTIIISWIIYHKSTIGFYHLPMQIIDKNNQEDQN